jgi:hypothetical protein
MRSAANKKISGTDEEAARALSGAAFFDAGLLQVLTFKRIRIILILRYKT